MVELNGIAHIQLTVSSVTNSRPFYFKLLHEALGMSIQYDQPGIFYCIGGRTGVLIRQADSAVENDRFDQWRLGLHHFCFRVKNKTDIDEIYKVLVAMGANIIRAPEEGPWAPGYYSVLCEDPDGIRIEFNHVPGRGNLDRIKDKPLSARPD